MEIRSLMSGMGEKWGGGVVYCYNIPCWFFALSCLDNFSYI